jgi:hypothetical protein
MSHDNDLMLLIGRVEGKVDTLVHLQSTAISRIEALEQRQNTTETKVAGIEARGEGSKTWLSNSLAILALFVSTVATYFGMK